MGCVFPSWSGGSYGDLGVPEARFRIEDSGFKILRLGFRVV